MILIQKQPTFTLTPAQCNTFHRRNPSAPPAVVVQPTRTPGLLSLSRPAFSSQQRRVKASPKSKPQPQSQQRSAATGALKPAVEITQATPEKNQQAPRGRQQAKDKTTRSVSQSRGQRHHGRQPSPPSSSQAEVPTTPTKPVTTNFFDPFLVDDPSPRPMQSQPARPPAPTLASRPSGKLAARRNKHAAAQTPPIMSNASKAIPVPAPKRSNNAGHISHSAPTVSAFPKKQSKAIKGLKHFPSVPLAHEKDVFPICDDLTEAGDLSEREESTEDDSDDLSLPSTPTRPSRVSHRVSQQSLYMSTKRSSPVNASAYSYAGFDDGPKTAPITATAPSASFPFIPQPNVPAPHTTPTKKGRGTIGRKHKRAPSAGTAGVTSLFNMSDDDIIPDVNKRKRVESMINLNRVLFPPPLSSTSQATQLTTAAAGGLFASSQFQNSPSPEELPPPTF